MERGELTAKDTPSLENVHEVKLDALLNDMVKKEGKIKTAQTLGVNYKTVARSIESGRLSVRLREALMTRCSIGESGLPMPQDMDPWDGWGCRTQVLERVIPRRGLYG